MEFGGYAQVDFKKIKDRQIPFLLAIVEMITITKKNKFTVKQLVKYINIDRKTIDKHLKRLVESEHVIMKTIFSPRNDSTRKITFYKIRDELLETSKDFWKCLNNN